MALRCDANIQMHTNDTNVRELTDPFGGVSDLQAKLVRTVGDPKERFGEDALRMMRAVRIATELGFAIESKTADAVGAHAAWIQAIAKERIRDELIKIFKSERSSFGIQLLADLGLLKFIMPGLEEGIGVGQNKHHIYSVWEHNLRAIAWVRVFPRLFPIACVTFNFASRKFYAKRKPRRRKCSPLTATMSCKFLR